MNRIDKTTELYVSVAEHMQVGQEMYILKTKEINVKAAVEWLKKKKRKGEWKVVPTEDEPNYITLSRIK